jgi:RNA polymerase sigma-70 factor (ECF subfamily)
MASRGDANLSEKRVAAAQRRDEPIVDPMAQQAARLMREAQQGDRMSFGQIVTLYQDRLYNAVLRLVGDVEEARELTQEAFTRALVKIDDFRGDSQPYTWLFRIAVNLSISQLRKVQRHRVFSIDGNGYEQGNGESNRAENSANRLAGTAPQPLEAMEKQERDEQVLAALGRLDTDYRAVLVMRDIEGFDYQQMASVLDLPLGTLKSRMFRARLALRDELKEYLRESR